MAEEQLVDTSAIYALNKRDDDDHEAARAHNVALSARMHTTSAVVAETYTLLRRRAGFEMANRVVSALRLSSFVAVHYVDEQFDGEIWRKLEVLRGIPLSYVDASLIVLGERLRIRRIFTFDDDFRAAGMDVVPGSE